MDKLILKELKKQRESKKDFIYDTLAWCKISRTKNGKNFTI